ncbi:MAG: hypothetical protein ACOVRB_04015 [Akkermansiaceae bacterium]
MKRSFSFSLVALLSAVIVSSCVPYDEYGRRIEPKRKPDPRTNVIDPKQQEIESKREELRLKEEERKKQLEQTKGETTPPPGPTTGDFNPDNGITDPPKPPTPPKNHPVAAAVPGKPGFVFSPFNNKVVDVRGIASGTLVADPQYPAAEKKHFRVP